MADTQFSPLGTVSVPADWTLPPSLEIVVKAVSATFDGTSAAASFQPAVEIISDSGHVVGVFPCATTLQAGASAEVSFFPFSGTATSSSTSGGGAWNLIQRQTLSSAGQFTFSSITQTYTDLMLAGMLKSTATTTGTGSCYLQFNGDTGANYTYQSVQGNDTAATAGGFALDTIGGIGNIVCSTAADANAATQISIEILNYANTNWNKTWISTTGSIPAGSLTQAFMSQFAGMWGNTAAVSSVRIFTPTGSFVANSVLSLYGR